MVTKTTKATSKTTTKRKSTSAGPRRSKSASTTSTSTTRSKAAKTPLAVVAEAETAKAATPEKAAEPASATPKEDDRVRRPDLIEAIAARVSLKRSEAKMVMDVMLDELGRALDENDEVVVPPLGKLMVKKRDVKPAGKLLTLKLKRAEPDPEVGDVSPLAKPEAEG